MPRTPHIVRQTLSVHLDEKAFALSELNFLTTDYKSLRRWQFIYVLRDGDVAEFVKDMGPAVSFKAPELRVYSFWMDSVGQLLEEADRMRYEDDTFGQLLAEVKGRSTLIPEFIAFKEEQHKLLRNASTFGPGFTRQRNEFIRRPA